MDTCIKTGILTGYCCAGSGEEGIIEDAKKHKCVHKVDGHMHKNRSIYLLAVVVQVVVKKVSWRM